MGYENNNAKATGAETERLAAQFLNQNGFLARRPAGPDTGIDLEITDPKTGQIITAQVKGRGRAAEPRWFQVSIGGREVERAVHENRLSTVWQQKIRKTDVWILVSLPLGEIWVLPSAKVIEIALANEPVYGRRMDNRYDMTHLTPKGAIAKKQKELNLDVLHGDQMLWQRYTQYRNSVLALHG